MQHNATVKVRLDKWLWAARFFKTRSLAQQAIEGGKVFYNGSRVKVSKEVSEGAEVHIRRGFEELTVIVKALSIKRGSATIAAGLYEETPASAELRVQRQAERKAAGALTNAFGERPSKRDRRKLDQFKHQNWQE